MKTVKTIHKPDRYWIFLNQDITIYSIEDYEDADPMMQPQEPNEHGVFYPKRQGFVFAMAKDYFFFIAVAKHLDRYFYALNLFQPESASCGCPSVNDPEQSAFSLRECLVKALNAARQKSFYQGAPPFPLYIRTANDALQRIRKTEAIQPSLFDSIDW